MNGDLKARLSKISTDFKKNAGGRSNLRSLAPFLGMFPDVEIADAVDLPIRVIRRYRNKRGISEFIPKEVVKDKACVSTVEDKMEKKEVVKKKSVIQLSQLEMDILDAFLSMVTDVGGERYRARKSANEILSAVSNMYDTLELHHVLYAIRSLEKMKVLLLVNGVKGGEVKNGLHSKKTFQLNVALLDKCDFVKVDKRGFKTPTYKKRLVEDLPRNFADVKGGLSEVMPAKETAHKSDSDIVDRAARIISVMEAEISMIKEGLAKIDSVRTELEARLTTLEAEALSIRQVKKAAEETISQLADMLPKE